jgi:hypothetical protein
MSKAKHPPIQMLLGRMKKAELLIRLSPLGVVSD